MKITIMDTTLRDGEQTSGVSFTDEEKLSMAKLLLDDLRVDRIEVASARVSEGEFAAVKKITEWAAKHNHINQVEVLGFVDGDVSINWIKNAGGKVLNLLTKGSLKHVTEQLKKTPEQHAEDIRQTVQRAREQGLRVNIYLEDWSNGMRHSPDYVFYMIDSFKMCQVDRIMLPDTLGILNPVEAYDFCKMIIDRYPMLQFDFHAHNDYDLAAANAFSALRAGIDCLHTTVNGLGERAGNVPLSSIVAIVKDHFRYDMSIRESRITMVSKLVESFSGIRVSPNKPVIGDNVFTQTSGIHADGDQKNQLYFNDLLPERFGRKRIYALGKTSGKANIRKNLEEMGIELDFAAMRKVTERIIELGDKKESVTQEDLPYIISDVLRNKTVDEKIKILNYSLSTANELKPVASLKIKIGEDVFEETANGDGQYDAFMKALRKIYSRLEKSLPALIDYFVSIPPGGKTDALVQTVITWKMEHEFKTRALDSDQTVAAIKATLKMLNIIENNSSI
ncbi:MAG TPA: alpha-isopropylmalate synthase regulatory domain-containing protein [Bacteroidales bacterium]|nr:alpha-isopropylmalate synthase regulatory domain-containing protein [Bacteroidales bacterium]